MDTSVMPGIVMRLEALAPRLFVAMIVVWLVAIFVASFYKYETYGQGYDQVDYEQAIWNTTQGRVMEDSRFNFTGSVFGMDWMPMLFLFVPAYALIPSAHTLFFLQILGAGLGAIPVYWLARDRLGSKLAGLGFGAAYLLFPVLLHGVLNPFQDRLFAVSLLLFAFYFYEKANWAGFWVCAGVALLARTDVALVVAMFGVYGLLTRRNWPHVVLPLAVGFGYFALAAFVILPAFVYPGAFAAPTGPVTDPMSCWPCGLNPQLAYYAHLGRTGPEIVTHVITHPVETAQLIFTGPKVVYMLSLLLPLLFLPLLEVRPLVLGLPTLALNLLSTREAQFDYQHHYSLLLIPGIFAAAIYGLDRLNRWLSRLRRDTDNGSWQASVVSWGVLALVVWGVIMQIPYKNPAVRAFLFPEPPATVAAANEMVRMVPQDAKVAASSKLAPHLLPRRYLYNFPPAPYSPYNFGPRQRDDYLAHTSAPPIDEIRVIDAVGPVLIEITFSPQLLSWKRTLRARKSSDTRRKFSSHPLGALRPLRGLFNRGPYATGGDLNTICMGHLATSPTGIESYTAPSYRQICDPADWDRSRSIHLPGQSGHPASPHYDDFVAPWLDGEYHPMLWTRAAVEGETAQRLTLRPAQ